MMKLFILLTLLLNSHSHASSTNTSNGMVFELSESHLIVMTKKEIEKKISELSPNAQHHILYFNPQRLELTLKSQQSLIQVLEKTHHKLPSMVSIITYHDANEDFDLAFERLEQIDTLLSKKGFQHQNLTNKLDNNELFIFLVSNCCLKQYENTIVLVKNKKQKKSILVHYKEQNTLLDKARATVKLTKKDDAIKNFRIMPQEEYDLRFGHLDAKLPNAPKKFRLFFKPQSTLLTDKSKAYLSKIAKSIHSRMPCVVDVIGYTDTTASNRYNLKLGLARAKTVSKILQAQGIDKKILKLKSYGEEDLFIPTPDNVSEVQNQNVEIFIK